MQSNYLDLSNLLFLHYYCFRFRGKRWTYFWLFVYILSTSKITLIFTNAPRFYSMNSTHVSIKTRNLKLLLIVKRKRNNKYLEKITPPRTVFHKIKTFEAQSLPPFDRSPLSYWFKYSLWTIHLKSPKNNYLSWKNYCTYLPS